jgi:hypothetical protein
MADQWALEAGQYYRSGDCERAMQLIVAAESLDPSRQELWVQRRVQIRAKSRTLPLEVELRTKLAAEGIAPDDPGLQQAAEWNRQVYGRNGYSTRAAQAERSDPEMGA